MALYRCPSCFARSRFNLIEQVVTPVKIDLNSGEIIPLQQLDPFHLPYKGPERRIQCASCGLTEDEIRFIKMAESGVQL
jgi:hypothetical protein